MLALSALLNSPDYGIDPRFPLFQQQLPRAKKSHSTLAAVLGDPSLVSVSSIPTPANFPDARIEAIARAWAEFNRSYQSSSNSKFDKYAARLGEPVVSTNSKGPAFVLPPYVVAGQPSDPWWLVSKKLFTATQQAVGAAPPCYRVVATTSVGALAGLLNDVPDERAVVWVSNFDELVRGEDDLFTFAMAIRVSAVSGKALFDLYGGFFSVLLSAFGLTGSSHGIGFSESRNWLELPSSGAPPARFYVPSIHRYMQPDEADLLYSADPQLIDCACLECTGKSPLELNYHEMMKHSVRCRAREITEWVGMSGQDMAVRLDSERIDFFDLLDSTGLPNTVLAKTRRQSRHLEEWAKALRRAAA